MVSIPFSDTSYDQLYSRMCFNDLLDNFTLKRKIQKRVEKHDLKWAELLRSWAHFVYPQIQSPSLCYYKLIYCVTYLFNETNYVLIVESIFVYLYKKNKWYNKKKCVRVFHKPRKTTLISVNQASKWNGQNVEYKHIIKVLQEIYSVERKLCLDTNLKSCYSSLDHGDE